ncbi:MAG: hypothetical protein FH749_11120 [Firmicutes bacterium]|nr:hypothetical protein [Bacillota bacterium]
MIRKVISPQEEVQLFLQALKELLLEPKFDPASDLDILMSKQGESPTDPYTTVNTMLDLNFDKGDVVKQLLALQVADYLETVYDSKDERLPPFYTFGKSIQNNDVYIRSRQKFVYPFIMQDIRSSSFPTLNWNYERGVF